jgi:hypothetical protein
MLLSHSEAELISSPWPKLLQRYCDYGIGMMLIVPLRHRDSLRLWKLDPIVIVYRNGETAGTIVTQQLLCNDFDSHSLIQIQIVLELDGPSAVAQTSTNAQRAPCITAFVCPSILTKQISRTRLGQDWIGCRDEEDHMD